MNQTFSSAKLYFKAKEYLGKRIPYDVPKELGCAAAVNYIFKDCFGSPITLDASTFTMYAILRNDIKFQEVEKPIAGDIIISPTSYGNGKLKNGHVGIVAKYGILSNNSENGLWQEKWNLEAWKKHYGEFGGFPVKYFRVQDGMSVAVIEQKKTIIERLVLLYKQLIELLSVKKLGSSMNKSSFSQTQLSNIGIAAGVLVMLAGRLGYVIDEKSVAFLIAGVWSLGWTAYSWYQRWKKGDLSLRGFRKHHHSVPAVCADCEPIKKA